MSKVAQYAVIAVTFAVGFAGSCGGDDDDDDDDMACMDSECATLERCSGGACVSCTEDVPKNCEGDTDCGPDETCVHCECVTSGTGACDPECADTETCDFDDNMCGSGLTGSCEDRQTGCPDVGAPACACDGVVYDNGCKASEAGQDVDISLSCATPPPGTFGCFGFYCDPTTQFCSATQFNPGQAPIAICRDLPGGCAGTSECACITVTDFCPGGGGCDDSAGGAVVLCN